MTTYNIIKIDGTGKETNYGGGYTIEDVIAVTRGYKYNGLFYERKNSKSIFIVEKDK